MTHFYLKVLEEEGVSHPDMQPMLDKAETCPVVFKRASCLSRYRISFNALLSFPLPLTPPARAAPSPGFVPFFFPNQISFRQQNPNTFSSSLLCWN